MPIDRPAVKAQSREIIRTAQPRVLLASLIILILSIVFSSLSARLIGISADDAMRYMRYVENGQLDTAVSFLLSRSPSAGERLVNLLINCVEAIMSLGFTIFLLNTVRGTGAAYANLLDGFGYWWKLLVLDLVTSVLVVLWSLLFIIPGIVAAYRYSFAKYLLITRPELGIMDCVRESKRLTAGHKGSLFMLDLSFIGWGLLSLVPIVGWILTVWLLPYREISWLLYFEKIAGLPESAQDRIREPWEI